VAKNNMVHGTMANVGAAKPSKSKIEAHRFV
jgi:hypothetical protein